MKEKIPKIIAIAFTIQALLFAISVVILETAEGLNGLFALYTIIPLVCLAPVIAFLAIWFPYKQWRQKGNIFPAVAVVINVLITATLIIRHIIIGPLSQVI